MDTLAVFGGEVTQIVVAALALLAVVGVGEGLRAMGVASPEATRRLVHVGVGLLVAAAPYAFDTPWPVYVLAASFVGANALAWHRGWFPSMHSVERQSIGTVLFPAALVVALAATWSVDPRRVFALQVAFLVLALADPLAAWVGSRAEASGRYRLGGAEKSWAGSAVFAGAAFAVTAAALVMIGPVGWTVTQIIVVAAVVAASATATEALAARGWDNLFIVVAVVVVLVVAYEQPGSTVRLAGAVSAGVIFGGLAWRAGVLAPSGAVAGGLLAASLVSAGGWAWIVPGLVFFVLSSSLSRVGRARKTEQAHRVEKGSVRDAGQVYANGGVAWALLLLYAVYPSPGWYLGYVGALAAAAADTWGTELGALSPTPPRSIRTGRRVPRGTSGGVSLVGSLAAGAGALSVAASAWLVVPGFVSGAQVGALILGGLAGAFVDSWAGATVQARYRDPVTGETTERTEAGGEALVLVHGVRWINNDRVNVLCTLVGAVAGLVASYLV